MRAGPAIVVGMLALAAVGAYLGERFRNRPERSVLLVTVDTLRADHVGATGRDGRPLTPRLDLLAREGALYTDAWTTAPLTVPAHATMLTGLVPPRHGLRSNRPSAPLAAAAERGWPTVAESFLAARRRTAAFVSASVLRADRTGLAQGFEVYDDVPAAEPGALHDTERRGEETVAAALRWVRGGTAPFFLWVHLFDPHAPYDAPAPFGAGPGHAADAEGYAAEVRYADDCIGRLLDGLEAEGHEDVVVAVVSDHGEALGEHGEATHGYLLHEATLRVPILLRAPHLVPAGRRISRPVSVAGLPAALLTLAGLPLPEHLAGGLPFAAPGEEGSRPAGPGLYAESLYAFESFRWAQVFAARAAPPAGATKLVEAGPALLLYDLDGDPRETAPRSLPPAGAPEVADLLSGLRAAARLAPLGGAPSAPPGAAPLDGGSYWGGGGPVTVLPAEENARLRNPYESMRLVAALDAAKAALAGGRPSDALAEFEAVASEDPQNPEAARWRGRALAGLGRHGEAVAAFGHAIELGFVHPDAVVEALVAAVRAGDPGAADRGLRVLADARGRGLPDTAWTLVFEAVLRVARDELDAAERALRAAESGPRDDRLERALRETREVLRAARAKSGG